MNAALLAMSLMGAFGPIGGGSYVVAWRQVDNTLVVASRCDEQVTDGANLVVCHDRARIFNQEDEACTDNGPFYFVGWMSE